MHDMLQTADLFSNMLIMYYDLQYCLRKATVTVLDHCMWCTVYYVHNRKWQDYVYIQCEYKSTKQKIKHLLREENKVKENKIS